MNIHKKLFGLVFLATPLLYFTVSVIWGKFILEKNTAINLVDNLAIIGIYYFFVSIGWLVNFKKIDTIAKKDR